MEPCSAPQASTHLRRGGPGRAARSGAALRVPGELLDVGDVVPRVPVERLLEAELVEVVAD
eukprot:CAMPEP_0179251970 /NCGR_PEP_ID=MMETSP0797-20121207/21965_1 /TAXON_ID=47934 /ORGANISM="Dinophysis acuminata, Strain DAEP01" /LENGTH=60 /DNA_ID=CAMNT_0020959769 /DNA_START=86 /DNA_END=265 /DNA_ORIENTATION=-